MDLYRPNGSIIKNVKEMLYISNKYMFYSGTDACEKFLKQSLTSSDAIINLQTSVEYHLLDLQCASLTYIDQHPSKCLENEKALDIDTECMKLIVESEEFNWTETEICKFAIKWANKKCLLSHEDPSGKNTRRLLGSLLYLIRFPLVDKQYFTNEIASVGLLNNAEIISTKFGQLDRYSFKSELLQNTDTDDLKPIRSSLFELTKKKEHVLLESRLIERTHRENGPSIEEKLSDDIYTLFNFLEGNLTSNELKPLISRGRRNTNAHFDTGDNSVHEVLNKMTNRETSTQGNSYILATLLEIKQSFNENLKTLNDKIETITEKFECEIKRLVNVVHDKDRQIYSLKTELYDEKEKVTRLRSEIKLQSQDLKDQEDKIRTSDEQRQNVFNKIVNRLESIDGKCKTLGKNTMSYSEALNRSAGEKIHSQTKTANSDLDNHQSLHYENNSINSANRDHVYNQENTMTKNTYVHAYARPNTVNIPVPTEQIQQIQTRVTNGDTSVFRGVVRKRSRRIVLYNVTADKPFELVDTAIRNFASSKGVNITFVKLLIKRQYKDIATYTLRANINERDFAAVENDDFFWPEGVYWRDYIPQNKHL
ncbi:BTBD1_2 [Mytilus edulis]|uniref:BTBD1_2 n=1 Tax=Mytilus edulis TaxID=6550 RepID=A0A8S3Q752_MYTED|nr:BTBD1_2 [Mytilus edulis]